MSTKNKDNATGFFIGLTTFLLLFGIGICLIAMLTDKVSINPVMGLFGFIAGVSALIYLHKNP